MSRRGGNRSEGRLRRRTRLLGAVSITAAAVLIGAEVVRVWRLGALPASHGDPGGSEDGYEASPLALLGDG